VAYTALVRSELRFTLWGWFASYRLHFAYARSVTPYDVERCSEWAAQLDIGGAYVDVGLGKLRAVQSIFTAVVSTEIAGPSQLQHLLLIPDAVGHGGDSFEPVPSAGQSIQLEWITGARGRGVNGRTYFPYFGRSVFVSPSLDSIDTAAADAVESTCSAFAFYTPTVVGGELVVCKRQLGGSPVSPLDSDKVVGVAVRRNTFAHQRRRVEWRRPYSPGP
jgi:hypothetical protein